MDFTFLSLGGHSHLSTVFGNVLGALPGIYNSRKDTNSIILIILVAVSMTNPLIPFSAKENLKTASVALTFFCLFLRE